MNTDKERIAELERQLSGVLDMAAIEHTKRDDKIAELERDLDYFRNENRRLNEIYADIEIRCMMSKHTNKDSSLLDRLESSFNEQQNRIAELERGRDELLAKAAEAAARHVTIRQALNDELAAAQATIQRKDEALRLAREKLAVYRASSTGEYKGGMEYTALVDRIVDALALPADRSCLDAMLADAEKRGMLKAAAICEDMDVAYIPCECADAIRQAAERGDK